MEPLLYTIDAFLVLFTIGGHIDVVDGCLERNLVVTTIDVGDGFGHFGNKNETENELSHAVRRVILCGQTR